MRSTILFNQEAFVFRIKGLQDENWHVIRFNHDPYPYQTLIPHVHGLSQDYCFNITLFSTKRLQIESWVDNRGVLTIQSHQSENFIHGIIAEASGPILAHRGYTYHVSLCSPLHLLNYHALPRVYIEKTVIEIIEDLLQYHGWLKGKNLDFEIKLKEKYFPIASSVQLDLSDFDFLSQLLCRFGLYFYFQQDNHNATLVIIDNIECVEVQKISEVLVSGTKNRLVLRTLPESIQYIDYHPSNPRQGVVLEAKNNTSMGGHGQWAFYGKNEENRKVGPSLVKVHQESIDWQRESFNIVTLRSDLQPGSKISVAHHPDPALNGPAIVISIRHEAEQTGSFLAAQSDTKIRYKNELCLIKINTPYRTPLTPISTFQGSLGARLENPNDNKGPYLDETGRYRFRYLFDMRSLAPCAKRSPATHQLQCLAGTAPEVGFHFPNHQDTELEVGFINGDINRPVILAALYDGNHQNVVTCHNAQHHIIKTKAGNELRFEDKRHAEKIILTTAHDKNFLMLDATKDKEQIYVGSLMGEMYLKSGQNMHWKTQQNIMLDLRGNYKTVIQKNYNLVAEQEINWHSGNELDLHTGRALKLYTEEGNFTASSQENTTLNADALWIQIEGQDYLIEANHGDIKIQAQGSIQMVSEQGHISFTQSGASLILSQDTLSIKSPRQIIIKGQYKNQWVGKQHRGPDHV